MSIRTLVFAATALTAICAPARAQDEPPPAPTPPAPPAAEDAVPGVGERVRVKLRNGRSVEGVLMAKDTWERKTPATGWTSVKREERGAGVRLWWTQDMDGFQFIGERDVVEFRSLGTVTQSDARDLVKRATDAAVRTTKEREKHEQAHEQEADANEQAKLLVQEVEKAKKEGEIIALADAKRKIDEAKAKRWAELLAKYPPGKWSVDLPKEIERRKTTLHLFPSEDEIEFLKVFGEWTEALAAWKAAQAAQAAVANGGK